MSIKKQIIKCLSLCMLVSNCVMAQDNTSSSVNNTSPNDSNNDTVVYGTAPVSASDTQTTYVAPSAEEKQKEINKNNPTKKT